MDATLLDNTNKLKLYLCYMNLTGKAFAALIGYTPATVNGYLNGTRKLSERAAILIEVATKGQVTREDVMKSNPK